MNVFSNILNKNLLNYLDEQKTPQNVSNKVIKKQKNNFLKKNKKKLKLVNKTSKYKGMFNRNFLNGIENDEYNDDEKEIKEIKISDDDTKAFTQFLNTVNDKPDINENDIPEQYKVDLTENELKFNINKYKEYREKINNIDEELKKKYKLLNEKNLFIKNLKKPDKKSMNFTYSQDKKKLNDDIDNINNEINSLEKEKTTHSNTLARVFHAHFKGNLKNQEENKKLKIENNNYKKELNKLKKSLNNVQIGNKKEIEKQKKEFEEQYNQILSDEKEKSKVISNELDKQVREKFLMEDKHNTMSLLTAKLIFYNFCINKIAKKEISNRQLKINELEPIVKGNIIDIEKLQKKITSTSSANTQLLNQIQGYVNRIKELENNLEIEKNKKLEKIKRSLSPPHKKEDHKNDSSSDDDDNKPGKKQKIQKDDKSIQMTPAEKKIQEDKQISAQKDLEKEINDLEKKIKSNKITGLELSDLRIKLKELKDQSQQVSSIKKDDKSAQKDEEKIQIEKQNVSIQQTPQTKPFEIDDKSIQMTPKTPTAEKMKTQFEKQLLSAQKQLQYKKQLLSIQKHENEEQKYNEQIEKQKLIDKIKEMEKKMNDKEMNEELYKIEIENLQKINKQINDDNNKKINNMSTQYKNHVQKLENNIQLLNNINNDASFKIQEKFTKLIEQITDDNVNNEKLYIEKINKLQNEVQKLQNENLSNKEEYEHNIESFKHTIFNLNEQNKFMNEDYKNKLNNIEQKHVDKFNKLSKEKQEKLLEFQKVYNEGIQKYEESYKLFNEQLLKKDADLNELYNNYLLLSNQHNDLINNYNEQKNILENKNQILLSTEEEFKHNKEQYKKLSQEYNLISKSNIINQEQYKRLENSYANELKKKNLDNEKLKNAYNQMQNDIKGYMKEKEHIMKEFTNMYNKCQSLEEQLQKEQLNKNQMVEFINNLQFNTPNKQTRKQFKQLKTDVQKEYNNYLQTEKLQSPQDFKKQEGGLMSILKTAGTKLKNIITSEDNLTTQLHQKQQF